MSALDTSVDDRRAGRVSTRAVVGSYVVAFIAAELLTAFVAPAAGAATDVAIAVFAIHHHGALRTPSGSDVGGRPSLSAFLLCLPVLCVARIAPFALPVAGVPAAWPGLVAVPIVVGVEAARRVREPGLWHRSWFSLRAWPQEVLVVEVALTSVLLSMLAFGTTRPAPLVRGSDPVILGVAAASLLVLGAVEELLYRGLIQTSLRGVAGRWSVVITALFAGAAALGDRSWTALLAVGVISLVFGVWFDRTGRLVGVALAHGMLLIAVFLIWPRLP